MVDEKVSMRNADNPQCRGGNNESPRAIRLGELPNVFEKDLRAFPHNPELAMVTAAEHDTNPITVMMENTGL